MTENPKLSQQNCFASTSGSLQFLLSIINDCTIPDVIHQTSNSFNSGIDDAISLGYNNVAFPFLILIIGLVGALGQLAVEAFRGAMSRLILKKKKIKKKPKI